MDVLVVRLELHHHSAQESEYLEKPTGLRARPLWAAWIPNHAAIFLPVQSEGRVRLQSHTDIQVIRLIRRHDSASPELLRMTCVLVSTVTRMRGTQQRSTRQLVLFAAW